MKQVQLSVNNTSQTAQVYPLEIINLLDVLARIELRRKQKISRKEVA